MDMTVAPDIGFEPPGPGSWMLDTTHHGRKPLTRYLQPFYVTMFGTGMPKLLERYGLPLKEFKCELVHGCFYVRPMAIGEPERPGKEPPALVLKLVARLHPELRRRNRIAAQAWSERRWRHDVDAWFERERDETIGANLALQAVDPAALDDGALVEHLAEASRYLTELGIRAFETHGGDLIPVGDYLAHCRDWGLDEAEAAALLRGASPASLETAEILAPVADALAGRGSPPSSIDEIRGLGTEVDRAVSQWLDLHGWRLLFSDDFDSVTLNERPDLQFKALLAAPHVVAEHGIDDRAVRQQVPAGDRDRFDELLAEARYGLRLRDDNVGIRWNWPAGLVRRALLEIGRRLVDRGAVAQPTDVLELDASEIDALMTDRAGPTRDEIGRRVAERSAVIAANPPATLGPPSSPPPLHAFPAPLARATAAMLASIDAMEGEKSARPLTGAGIGDTTVRGRSLVVDSAHEAFDRIEQGDIIVTPFTSPTWNSLLPLAGGLVVEEGGQMCHAAIVAREFGIPAVVGVDGATRLIADGSLIELDAATGQVELVV